MRNYLKKLRLSAGLTQAELAEKLGVSQNGYNMIERGSRQSDISLSLLLGLADALGIPVSQLIDEENKTKQLIKKEG